MELEAKLRALWALNNDIRIGADADVWVSLPGVEIADGKTLTGLTGHGMTIDTAIDQLWRKATDLNQGARLVTKATNPTERRAYRWNGFMWAPYAE